MRDKDIERLIDERDAALAEEARSQAEWRRLGKENGWLRGALMTMGFSNRIWLNVEDMRRFAQTMLEQVNDPGKAEARQRLQALMDKEKYEGTVKKMDEQSEIEDLTTEVRRERDENERLQEEHDQIEAMRQEEARVNDQLRDRNVDLQAENGQLRSENKRLRKEREPKLDKSDWDEEAEMNVIREAGVLWFNGISATGLMGAEPFAGRKVEGVEGWWDHEGDRYVDGPGEHGKIHQGLVTFASWDRKEVWLWTMGAKRVCQMLGEWADV